MLPSLLFKINENQLALEAAIIQLSNRVEQRGSTDIAKNVRGALWAFQGRVWFCLGLVGCRRRADSALSIRSIHSLAHR
ncbi:hypothetical protein [Pseudomonas protegens]